MNRGKKKKKVVYREGYDHYDTKKTIAITFYVNEAEKVALDDLMAVMEVKNQSAFIRGRVLSAYNDLTAEQKAKLEEVAEWRAKEDQAGRPSKQQESEK